MKKLMGIILLVASIMLALLTGIGTFIIGFKILKMLWFEEINPMLCLQFLGFVLALGTFMALATLAGKMCNVDVNFTSDTIVGKHEEDEDDGCILDYDSATLYPSSKMGLSLDLMVPQINNHESENETKGNHEI